MRPFSEPLRSITTGASSAGLGRFSSAKRFEAEDLRQDDVKHRVGTVRISAVLIAAAVAVFIAATEALAEVVVVVVSLYVITVIAVVCVLIPIRTLVVGTPAILAVRLSSPESFLVTVVNGLTEIICGVLINLVVVVATMVTVDRSRVKLRIAIVIRMTAILEVHLLLTLVL